jgi:hypothetical protein
MEPRRKRRRESDRFNRSVRLPLLMRTTLLLLLCWISFSAVNANSEHNDKQTTTTFVMGLPKSGSHAIHSFVQCMNVAVAGRRPLASSHYCCDPKRESNDAAKASYSSSSFSCEKPLVPCGSCVHEALSKGKNLWSAACGNYDVYAALFVESTRPYSYFLPQHFLLPYFVSPDTNSHVTWILNTRASPDTWASHVAHWYSVTKRLLKSFGIPYYSSDSNANVNAKVYLPSPAVTTSDLQDALDASFERMHDRTDHLRRLEALRQIYSNHTRKIQQFVQYYNQVHSQKKIQFYQIDVDDAVSAPTILATALGYDTDSAATAALIEQCWTFNATQLDNDWLDFSIGPGTHW